MLIKTFINSGFILTVSNNNFLANILTFSFGADVAHKPV